MTSFCPVSSRFCDFLAISPCPFALQSPVKYDEIKIFRVNAGIAIPGVTGFAYAYDADRRKLAETDSEQASADQRFAYDSQDRLVSWKRGTGTAPTDPATATQTWNLSPVGDWTSTAIDGTTQLRTHTAVHELTAIGGTALAYDAKGNLTRDDQGQTFAWDPENRLAAAGSLHQGQGDSATYAYDALGRRVKKTVTTGAATVPSLFVNAGAQEVVEITGDLTALGDATADPEPAGAAPYNPGTGTGARGSLLADPLAQRCNAQPATTDTPDGWVADTGALAPTSADRGWSTAVAGVDRDHLGRPLYDSFLPLSASTWSIPVANGTHAVVIMCGDADSRQQTNHLLVNGVSVTDPTPYDGNVTLGYETGSFDGYALTVNVTGGLLTISADSGALNPKIDFIEIGATGSTIDAETTARVQAAATQATHDTAKGKAKTPPFVKRSIWGGSYVDDLTSYTVQKPRHAPIRYFAHSNHLYSVAAVTTDGAPLDDISSYVPVVSENQSYALTGVCDVAYGESGHYVFRAAQTGTVTFNNATFGDPMYGTVKRGFVRRAAKQIAERYIYNAYGFRTIKSLAGVVLSASAVGQDQGFTGYQLDEESKLYYARDRMYSAIMGRFISRDHAHGNVPQVGGGYHDGYGLYSGYFVPNYLDPSGRGVWWADAILWVTGGSDPNALDCMGECVEKEKNKIQEFWAAWAAGLIHLDELVDDDTISSVADVTNEVGDGALISINAGIGVATGEWKNAFPAPRKTLMALGQTIGNTTNFKNLWKKWPSPLRRKLKSLMWGGGKANIVATIADGAYNSIIIGMCGKKCLIDIPGGEAPPVLPPPIIPPLPPNPPVSRRKEPCGQKISENWDKPYRQPGEDENRQYGSSAP